MTGDEAAPGPTRVAALRWAVAGLLFLLGLFAPAAIPLLKQLGISGAALMALSAGLVFGIPEVFFLLAVAVLGKAGFEQGKRWLYGRLRRLAPPGRVGRGRYRIGLAMLVLPLLAAWLGPYFAYAWPQLIPDGIAWLVAGDALFIVSLFVLGGEFWDKLRALFVHGATVRFP